MPTSRRAMSTAADDCTCPVCLSILVEPVVMPCRHELCRACFASHVEQTSLVCPICRLRIGSWARRSARAGTLVDMNRWAHIQKLYRKELQERDSSNPSTSAGPKPPAVPLAQPGEIYREYLAELTKLRAEEEEQRRRMEAEGEALAKRLQAEEEAVAEAELADDRSPAASTRAASAASSVAEPSYGRKWAAVARHGHAGPLPGEGASVVAAADSASSSGNVAATCRRSPAVLGSRAALQSASGSWQSRFRELPVTDQQQKAGQPLGDLSNTSGRPTSIDSLGPELNVFKPIQSFPLTPPRDGKRRTGAGAPLLSPKAARMLLDHVGADGSSSYSSPTISAMAVAAVSPYRPAAHTRPAAYTVVEAVEAVEDDIYLGGRRLPVDSGMPETVFCGDDRGSNGCGDEDNKGAIGQAVAAVAVTAAATRVEGRGKRPLRCSVSSSSSTTSSAATSDARPSSDVRPPSLTDERTLPLPWQLGSGGDDRSSGSNDGVCATPACPSALSCHPADECRGDDSEYARLLQSMYDMERKYRLNGVRMPGSGLEYSLRRKPRGGPSQQPPSHPLAAAAAAAEQLEANCAEEPPPAKRDRRSRFRRC